jgi:hypothetical protein
VDFTLVGASPRNALSELCNPKRPYQDPLDMCKSSNIGTRSKALI